MEIFSSRYSPLSEWLSVFSPARLHRAYKSVPKLFKSIVMVWLSVSEVTL